MSSSFLIWAVLDFRSARRRDASGVVEQMQGPPRNDVIAVVAGLAIYGAFLFWLHDWLIGLPII